MKNYSFLYIINGIYGEVDFDKNIDLPESELSNFLEADRNVEHSDFFSFWVGCKETETGRDIGTTETIKGLPSGITEDMYFKMAMLRDAKMSAITIVEV